MVRSSLNSNDLIYWAVRHGTCRSLCVCTAVYGLHMHFCEMLYLVHIIWGVYVIVLQQFHGGSYTLLPDNLRLSLSFFCFHKDKPMRTHMYGGFVLVIEFLWMLQSWMIAFICFGVLLLVLSQLWSVTHSLTPLQWLDSWMADLNTDSDSHSLSRQEKLWILKLDSVFGWYFLSNKL